jgi:Omp85 superfamily domain
MAFRVRGSVRCATHAGAVFILLSRLAGAETPQSDAVPAKPSPDDLIVPAGSGSLGDSATGSDGSVLVDGIDDAANGAAGKQRRGHLVIVPIPFRNPLLGAGLTLGAGYLYRPKDATSSARHSVAGVGGMYAEGGSWAAAGGHRGYWSGERFRSTLGVGTGELLYDLHLHLQGSDQKIPLAQEFKGASADAAFKVGKYGWLGAGFVYGTTTVRPDDLNVTPPAGLNLEQEISLANLKFTGEWDSRDSDVYPRSGYRAESEISVARDAWGSDDDYEVLELQFNGYRSFGDRHVLAYRVYGKTVGGDPPFFALAWYGSGGDLRGYTPGTFIGKSMIAAQAEWRWQATARWGFVAFGGTGTISSPFDTRDSPLWLPAGGAGVRFKILKSLALNMRADYAWGRDDSTFTLSVGEAF